MRSLLSLFQDCAWNIHYKKIGSDVDIAFTEEGDRLFIWFAGSNSVTDWLRNFMFKKKPYKDMAIPWRAHRGFLAAWKEAEDTVIEKILEPAEPGTYDWGYKWKEIVIVGYSHGGALAAFCHECVWFHRQDLRENGLVGYGFEAPRIFGGFKVPGDLEERWRTFAVVRNKNDIVTHCPPAIFRFCHVGRVMQIGQRSKLNRHTWLRCVDAHFPDNVAESLKEAKEPAF